MRLVVGIDASGSVSTAIIVTSEGTVIAEGTDRSINLQDVNVHQAASVLIDLIQICCQRGNCTPESLKAVVVGIGGIVDDAQRSFLSSALFSLSGSRKIQIKNLVVESDARVAIEAAFAGGPGIVVVVNAGSVAFYKTEEGKMIRAGGWGKFFGDEGSAFAIGRDAIAAVLRQYDGRGDKTLLSKKVMDYFHLAKIEDLPQQAAGKELDISLFATEVLQAEREGDRIAHAILMKNAHDLAELVRAVALQVRPKIKIPVTLMGDFLGVDTVYAKMVKDRIKNSLPFTVIQKPKFPPAFGAAIIGLNAFK
jgi:N-acetylglucosamine kinase-like BadF-type ATPase